MLILGLAAWVFWLLVVLALVMFFAVESESSVGAFATMVGVGALLHFSNTVDMLHLLQNWQGILMFLAAWLGVGLAWCFVKWTFYTGAWARRQREEVQNARKRFLSVLGLKGDTIPEEHKEAWTAWVNGNYIGSVEFEKKNADYRKFEREKCPVFEKAEDLHVRNNWKRMMVWGLYWPWSMVWTIIDDPLKRIFKFLVLNVFGGSLQWFSNRAALSVEKEIKK